MQIKTRWGARMDLKEKTAENLAYMLEKMSVQLDVANKLVFDPKGYDLSKYDDIKYMYEFIMKKDTLSTAETSALVDELRSVRLD